MASVEPGDDVVEGRLRLVLVQGEDAGQHCARPGVLLVEALVTGNEQPRDDAGGIGPEALRVASALRRRRCGHAAAVARCCACCRVASSGQRGLGALVAVHAAGLEAVEAATGAGSHIDAPRRRCPRGTTPPPRRPLQASGGHHRRAPPGHRPRPGRPPRWAADRRPGRHARLAATDRRDRQVPVGRLVVEQPAQQVETLAGAGPGGPVGGRRRSSTRAGRRWRRSSRRFRPRPAGVVAAAAASRRPRRSAATGPGGAPACATSSSAAPERGVGHRPRPGRAASRRAFELGRRHLALPPGIGTCAAAVPSAPDAPPPAVVQRRLVLPPAAPVHAVAVVAVDVPARQRRNRRLDARELPDLGARTVLPRRHDEDPGHVVGAVAVLGPRSDELGVLERAPLVGHRRRWSKWAQGRALIRAPAARRGATGQVEVGARDDRPAQARGEPGCLGGHARRRVPAR